MQFIKIFKLRNFLFPALAGKIVFGVCTKTHLVMSSQFLQISDSLPLYLFINTHLSLNRL